MLAFDCWRLAENDARAHVSTYVRTYVRTYACAPSPEKERDMVLSRHARTRVRTDVHVRTYAFRAQELPFPPARRAIQSQFSQPNFYVRTYPIRPRALGRAISSDMALRMPRPRGVSPGTWWLQQWGCTMTNCRCPTVDPIRHCCLYQKSADAILDGQCDGIFALSRFFEDAVLHFLPAGTYMYVVQVEETDRYTSIQVRCTHPEPGQLAWPSSGHPEAWAVLWARTPESPDDAIMGMMSAIPVSHDDARQTIALYDAQRRKPARPQACAHACDHTLTGSRWDNLLGSIGSRCGRRCVGQTEHEGLHRCVFHTLAGAPAGAAASASGGNATPASSASGPARPDEPLDLFRCRFRCDHVLTFEKAWVSGGLQCGCRCVGERNHEGLHKCERHHEGLHKALRRCKRGLGAADSASGGEAVVGTLVRARAGAVTRSFKGRGGHEEQRQEAAAEADRPREHRRGHDRLVVRGGGTTGSSSGGGGTADRPREHRRGSRSRSGHGG